VRLSVLVCGINFLTYAAKLDLHVIGAPAALPVNQARHETGELQQVHDAKKRPTLANDDFWIRAIGVGPLWRNRANRRIIDAQQKPLAGSVEPLAHTGELSPTQWVKRKRPAFRVLRRVLVGAYVDGDSCQGSNSLMRLIG
jgi:hypothetical protein